MIAGAESWNDIEEFGVATEGFFGSLQQDVEMSVKVAMASGFSETSHDSAKGVDKGHGRIEVRESWVIGDDEVVNWINSHHNWPGLRATGMVRAERRIGTKVEQEDRYYLLSKNLMAVEFAQKATQSRL